jgi:hypothetical protein
MCKLNKCLKTLSACIVFGAAAVMSASSGADGKVGRSHDGLNQVATSLEKALPAFVSAEDYRSASNTAFLLATARSRLDQTVAACAALSQSLEYYRKALANGTDMPEERGADLNDDSSGMAEVRAKFGCARSHSA